MTWAKQAIEDLEAGANSVVVKPRGSSMHPKVKDGATVTVCPIVSPSLLTEGDVVLVTVKGYTYLHLIKRFRGHGDKLEVMIGNNHGRLNGWTSAKNVHGIAREIVNG